MKLVNWRFLDFQLKLRCSTPLFSVKKKLRDKHGLIKNLKLYKGQRHPSNELIGDELTLSELGIQGAAKEAQDEEVYEIYYDFKPADAKMNNPLLLVTPRSHVDA